LLEHPHYSPDLVPSDFCLFPKLKLFLAGQCFSSNQEAIAALLQHIYLKLLVKLIVNLLVVNKKKAVERYFSDLTKNHYRDGIMALEHRWNKCISLKGDYVEK
jgi:hypothetical protein